jgi:DNA polymerase III alpha subunit
MLQVAFGTRIHKMKKMINLALRTEFSFGKTFGFADSIIKNYSEGHTIGIADINNTFGHVLLEKTAAKLGIKPIFGVRLMVVRDATLKGKERYHGPEYIFLAKNNYGLREIYRLVKKSYDQFHYWPRIGLSDVLSLSEDVIVIAQNFFDPERIDYIALSPSTPAMLLDWEIPKVAINNNDFSHPWDRGVYELLTDGGWAHTYPQHILSTEEWMRICNDEDAINNTHVIADMCEHFTIEKAPMVKYTGYINLDKSIQIGAKNRKIDITEEPYKSRLEKELELIYQKNFSDYFLVVADMIEKAKNKGILVGPSRGSSAGSLVCYLLGITEIDPIPFGLIFERFIDINRADLPDIDIDFPDNKRQEVIKQLEKDYGPDRVGHIATISKLKPKSAIGLFAKALNIPPYETEEVKDAILERSGGDARAAMCIMDTFETTDVGRVFIEKFPQMKLVEKIENHSNHAGVHAAGIIVCNNPLVDYVGRNTRDDMVMVDKKEAEYLNLLKIDVLGLRTLAVLTDCAKLAGLDPKIFYTLPLDDEDSFKLITEGRWSGVFQFEGQALQFVTRQIGVHEFNDIVAITALARPGSMNSGGTNKYIKAKLGEEVPFYYDEIHERITGETFGVTVYQEQMMRMAREIGSMSWPDVSALRTAASKSLGDEFFSKYKDKFIQGATEVNGYSIEDANSMWSDIQHSGSWIFNKSHAVSYALISYWTAWAKAHYPLEFAAANLNNAKDDESALKLLRDMVENDGVEYEAFDPDVSVEGWSIHDGKLIGGLTSIKGIGEKKAADIVMRRKNGLPYTPSIVKMMMYPETIFSSLYPCRDKWGEIYTNPNKFGLINSPMFIRDVTDGDCVIIGKVISRDLRDRNDYQSIQKRGGKKVDKNQFYLKFYIEDDTDSVMCMISPQDFDKLNGRMLSETLKEGETWVIVRGEIRSEWRMVTAKHIFNLTEWEKKNER